MIPINHIYRSVALIRGTVGVNLEPLGIKKEFLSVPYVWFSSGGRGFLPNFLQFPGGIRHGLHWDWARMTSLCPGAHTWRLLAHPAPAEGLKVHEAGLGRPRGEPEKEIQKIPS